ncbi:DUF6153 family protein [Subtercola boreus]|uniref:Uncharacterized protein n=1 Tax=Subtercola boreus TaxID=120213 RepID=A0A3E0W9S2_9MICO|nr:DUF6153 family protein [Subtercola boreus]RFA18097.1 hypothetical protein B7R24_15740 [Subtercola boreus]RFA18479.1 hypothetical protein B7R23_15775 [Subtercola boreus]RFA25007.1 hypothetical protein B7R25_15770 [Subtercola boreus]
MTPAALGPLKTAPVSLRRTRAHILGANTIQRTVFLLAVVGAVVVGLLAMHTLQTGMGNHNAPMNTTSAMGGPAHPGGETVRGLDHGPDTGTAAAHEHATASECSGMCDPGHTMAGMVCVLALLLTGLLLAAIRPASTSTTTPVTPALLQRADVAAARPRPAPPDLHVLSISRT